MKADVHKRRTALIAAGGTGGHLFPAESLARELAQRGWRIELATDERVQSYGKDFPAAAIHLVPSATPSGGGMAQKLAATVRLSFGTLASMAMIAWARPAVAIGFGGYPTVPPIAAAAWLGVPTLIHDANAVLGRANRFLAGRVKAIAVSSPSVKVKDERKLVMTGNPVRPPVLDAAKTPYPTRTATEPFRLLVFGGSQGARVFSDLVPAALELLKPELRALVRLTQQCRAEDLERVRAAYRGIGVEAELQPFFRDLPSRIALNHLVVCRSGASSVSELAVIGRPAVLVPLPGAIDQDQKANALALAEAGGGLVIEQSDLTPGRLAKEISAAIEMPAPLAAMSSHAKRIGRPDAVQRLADLVEAVAARRLNAKAPSTDSG